MFLTAFLILLVSSVGFCFVRAYTSPIRYIPGPYLAKLTYWYEFYYDFILRGRYVFKISELHEQYGPIIQINPHEIHINDPDFYPTLFTGPLQKRDKWSFFTAALNMPDSTFATIKHDQHRVRRSALNPFFGKAKIRSLQPLLEKTVDKLLVRMDGFAKSKEPLNMTLGFTAMTNDIAEDYAFDRNANRTEAPDFDPGIYYAGEAAGQIGPLTKQFPWLLKFMDMLPDSMVIKMNPQLGVYVLFQRRVQGQVKEIMHDSAQPDYKLPERTTIFHEILNANIPPQEKSFARLWQDGHGTILAGTITTSLALSYMLFTLITQPNELRRLKEELLQAIPDPTICPSLAKLEQLPYLTACIKEALRVGNGVTSRLQRIDPDKEMVFTDHIMHKGKEYSLPPGTPIGMTAMLMHLNSTVFEDPTSFKPERWLSKTSVTVKELGDAMTVDDQGKTHVTSTSHPLDRYLQPFSAGTRQCVGINLAYAELFLTVAKLFRVYGSEEVRFPDDKGYMVLYETTYEQELEIMGDGLTPFFRKGNKGIRVKVHQNVLTDDV